MSLCRIKFPEYEIGTSNLVLSRKGVKLRRKGGVFVDDNFEPIRKKGRENIITTVKLFSMNNEIGKI